MAADFRTWTSRWHRHTRPPALSDRLRAPPLCLHQPLLQDRLRVLVVAAGLGTGTGDGLEAPIAVGKFVSDGAGGVVEIDVDERRARWAAQFDERVDGVSDGRPKSEFAGWMGSEFFYKWERHWMYKGNAGFLVCTLLSDPLIDVDILTFPSRDPDKDAVVRHAQAADPGLDDATVRERLNAEGAAMWKSHSDSHARSISHMLQREKYDVVLSASKGLSMLSQALDSTPAGSRLTC